MSSSRSCARSGTRTARSASTGKHYRFEDFQTDIKPVQERIPVSVGGSSPQAYDVGGRLGDIFGLWGEPLKETAEQIAAVNAIADAAGRPRPRIWNSFRPIVAADRRAGLGEGPRDPRPDQAGAAPRAGNQALGALERQRAAERRLGPAARGGRASGDLHDRALWTPLAKELKGAGLDDRAGRQLRDRRRRRWSTTRRSAATCCRSAAGTSTTTWSTTAATCCRWCARSSPTARRPAPPRSSTPTHARWPPPDKRNGGVVLHHAPVPYYPSLSPQARLTPLAPSRAPGRPSAPCR